MRTVCAGKPTSALKQDMDYLIETYQLRERIQTSVEAVRVVDPPLFDQRLPKAVVRRRRRLEPPRKLRRAQRAALRLC